MIVKNEEFVGDWKELVSDSGIELMEAGIKQELRNPT
jgi:hypothetical protein